MGNSLYLFVIWPIKFSLGSQPEPVDPAYTVMFDIHAVRCWVVIFCGFLHVAINIVYKLQLKYLLL